MYLVSKLWKTSKCTTQFCHQTPTRLIPFKRTSFGVEIWRVSCALIESRCYERHFRRKIGSSGMPQNKLNNLANSKNIVNKNILLGSLNTFLYELLLSFIITFLSRSIILGTTNLFSEKPNIILHSRHSEIRIHWINSDLQGDVTITSATFQLKIARLSAGTMRSLIGCLSSLLKFAHCRVPLYSSSLDNSIDFSL